MCTYLYIYVAATKTVTCNQKQCHFSLWKVMVRHLKTVHHLESFICYVQGQGHSGGLIFKWLPHVFWQHNFLRLTPQWGAADAEIKVPSGENTELKRSPFKAWSKSAYSHTCYAYCQGFLSCLILHFRSIHLHFFQNFSRFFPVLAVANTRFLCRPTE